MFILLQIALGGAIGATARYLLSSAITRLLGAGFPWGTLLVNLSGCFGIGLAAALLLGRDTAAARYAPFVIPGLLGGFTTFSAFTLEIWLLVDRGRPLLAAAYLGGSVAFGLLALIAGMTLVRLWTQA